MTERSVRGTKATERAQLFTQVCKHSVTLLEGCRDSGLAQILFRTNERIADGPSSSGWTGHSKLSQRTFDISCMDLLVGAVTANNALQPTSTPPLGLRPFGMTATGPGRQALVALHGERSEKNE